MELLDMRKGNNYDKKQKHLFLICLVGVFTSYRSENRGRVSKTYTAVCKV